MKYIYYLFMLFFMAAGCSNNEQNNTEQEIQDKNTEAIAAKEQATYGKIQHVDIKPEIDKEMAKQGLRIFDVTCTSCHKYDERYVGPPLGDVAKKRTPEYVMNMILDTETMIDKDDTVKCLLQTYLMKMPNMQVDEKDARSVLEHLREVAQQ